MSSLFDTVLSWSNRQVAVLGLGASGLAMVRWAVRCGAQVRVWDSREQAPMRSQLPAGVEFFHGAWNDAQAQSFLSGVHVVLKSPGLSPHDASLAALMQTAQAMVVPVQGELDVFAQALQQLAAQAGYQPTVLAITGTNGKTTTTALTAHLLRACDQRVAVAGNIGPTLLDTLTQALQDDALQWPQSWVLELSSFQLHGVQGFSPTAATVLNISQDHLDWHADMPEYVADKARIFGEMSAPSTACLRVLNRDDAAVAGMQAPQPVAPKKGAVLARRQCSFGLNGPMQAGDYGLVDDQGMVWLAWAQPTDAAHEFVLQRLMPVDALRIRGRHNAANAMAALALARAACDDLGSMLHGLRDYAGEPHRVQSVTVIDGIEVYDDSKGTNVGATEAAIAGLGADKSPGRLVLILGGDGKGQDFSSLLEPLQRHARAVALIGKDADRLALALSELTLPVLQHPDLTQATHWALEQAQSGDAVLLSPACASLDMFRNYSHRGECFVQAVREWHEGRGGVWI